MHDERQEGCTYVRKGRLLDINKRLRNVFLSFFFVFFNAVSYVTSIWLLPFQLLSMSNNLPLRTYVQPSCLSSRTSVLPSVALISLYYPFPHLFLTSLHFSHLPVNLCLLSFLHFILLELTLFFCLFQFISYLMKP